ncbi:MAG: hypothetical protein AAFW75_02365 [Cyanobacteria bacterium J06636_16]
MDFLSTGMTFSRQLGGDKKGFPGLLAVNQIQKSIPAIAGMDLVNF